MQKETLAYVIGIAIGDGNLSNPNKRAVRLRITCDNKYENTIINFVDAIQQIMPANKVSVQKRKVNCVDISCYSNKWENILGWKVGHGSKCAQNVSVPSWIKRNKKYCRYCLKCLFETDGSVYKDRAYLMANFVTTIPALATAVLSMIEKIGFYANMQIFRSQNKKRKYTIRVSKNVDKFVRFVNIDKS